MIKKINYPGIIYHLWLPPSPLFAQQNVNVSLPSYPNRDHNGNIIPWYNADPAIAYDHDLHIIWDFWFNMRRDPNGLPYYMDHQVWNKTMDDPRGIGGDQFMMAMSSWRLYYAYTGDENVKSNIYFLVEYYLTHRLVPRKLQMARHTIPLQHNDLFWGI